MVSFGQNRRVKKNLYSGTINGAIQWIFVHFCPNFSIKSDLRGLAVDIEYKVPEGIFAINVRY